MEFMDNILPGHLITVEKEEHLSNVLDEIMEEGAIPHIVLRDKSHPLFSEVPKEIGKRDLILITIKFKENYEA